MISFYSEDIELLKELYAEHRISFYFFHKKYGLSPSQLGRSINKFKKEKVITIEDDNICLTEHGKNWIFYHRRELFLKEKSKYWKDLPEEMSRNALTINELYIPNRKSLDKELFNNNEGGN